MELADRILMALGGLRDEMTAEDVKAVQRFAQRVRSPIPMIATWRGTPIDHLSPEQVAEYRAYLGSA